MSCIFLSHSSVDEREAIALKQWLADNGWDDVFLDVDPERGLVAGERWQEALSKAEDRCEAVIFVVSPAWTKSKWCLAEFLLAKSLRKPIFGVVIKDVQINELPNEMTSEWQLCHLVGGGSTETVRFTARDTLAEVAFLADGLKRLRNGLNKAGLGADFFPWPPKHDPTRAPYRGLEPLESCDAAVFFGREVEILRGLDVLRGMRAHTDQQLFVILGASGSGKSSFLRAGLLPRLARDDRHFLPLPVIRPERDPLFGDRGLAQALQRELVDLKQPSINLGDIKERLRTGPKELASLLEKVQQAARNRVIISSGEAAPPTPSLILSVDQAEELFNADAGEQARTFLRLLGTVLRTEYPEGGAGSSHQPMIVVFTIRSDRYEPLQASPELAGIRSIVFDELKPMPPTRFREVIIGPAQRVSIQGSKLGVKPDLVDRLVNECTTGGDTLPLLGLALARLYRDYGSDGDLCLGEYETMGGLANIVNTEIESLLSIDEGLRKQQLVQLHDAFIPWLATINKINNQPMRRLANRSDLPPMSLDLIDALAEKRLLLTDMRDGKKVVEVAHESLLRNWHVLAKWLEVHGDDLKDADALEDQVLDWKKNGEKNAWLWEGERLSKAEALYAKLSFHKRLDVCQDFILASRRREDFRRADEERHRHAELESAQSLAAEQAARADIEEKAKNAALASSTRLKKNAAVLTAALALMMLGFLTFTWLYYNGLTIQHALTMAQFSMGLHKPKEPEMLTLPSGGFWMGSDDKDCEAGSDEIPRHWVEIPKPFNMAIKEVTFAEYDLFAYATGRTLPDDLGWGRINHPVINVSWEDVVAYAEWLEKETGKAYRLPTEVEWEYAARAGTEKSRFWGDEPENACKYANVCDKSCSEQYNEAPHNCNDHYVHTANVGEFVPNDFKLYDMIGNVWEWTADCDMKIAPDVSGKGCDKKSVPDDSGTAYDEKKVCKRVLRGGSWFSNPGYARSAKRIAFNIEGRNFHIGFRLARD